MSDLDLLSKGFVTSLEGEHYQVLLNIKMPMDADLLLATVREHLIEQALRLMQGNQTQAARLLMMKRTTLIEALNDRYKSKKRKAA